MFSYSYTDLHRATDLLWPGQADEILADPTDEQLALILAVLDDAPCERFLAERSDQERTLSNQTTLQVRPIVAF